MKRNMLARVAALSMCAALFLAGCGSDSKSEDKKTSTGKTAAASTEKEELHVAISTIFGSTINQLKYRRWDWNSRI